MRVLIISEGPSIASDLASAFDQEGHAVRWIGTGDRLEAALTFDSCDLIALDLGGKGWAGPALTRRIRAMTDAPLIVVCAHGDATDRIAGLELGADNFFAKPFDPLELLARARALACRSAASRGRQDDASVYLFAGWTLDDRARDLKRWDGMSVELTAAEFDLLSTFLRCAGQVLSRAALLERLRGRAWSYFDRSIDTAVARLRRKIETGGGRPALIRSVRGVGYVFCGLVRRHPAPTSSETAAA